MAFFAALAGLAGVGVWGIDTLWAWRNKGVSGSSRGWCRHGAPCRGAPVLTVNMLTCDRRGGSRTSSGRGTASSWTGPTSSSSSSKEDWRRACQSAGGTVQHRRPPRTARSPRTPCGATCPQGAASGEVQLVGVGGACVWPARHARAAPCHAVQEQAVLGAAQREHGRPGGQRPAAVAAHRAGGGGGGAAAAAATSDPAWAAHPGGRVMAIVVVVVTLPARVP